ncbi:hypothetical protein [Staphylococcus epidermidis]|nr:hypothetical protein [Staphylococcus epidermidis]
MNRMKSRIDREGIFRDDEEEGYLVKKRWDEKKGGWTVIRMYGDLEGVL